MILEKIRNPKGHPKPTIPNPRANFDTPHPALLTLIDEPFGKANQLAETLKLKENQHSNRVNFLQSAPNTSLALWRSWFYGRIAQ